MPNGKKGAKPVRKRRTLEDVNRDRLDELRAKRLAFSRGEEGAGIPNWGEEALLRLNEWNRIRSMKDGLTGLHNFAFVRSVLVPKKLPGVARLGRAVSFVGTDFQGLKMVNDLAGDTAGDKALRAIAETLTSKLRNEDVVVRKGGDEIFLMLHTDSSGEAAKAMDRVNSFILRHPDVQTIIEKLRGVSPETVANDGVRQKLLEFQGHFGTSENPKTPLSTRVPLTLRYKILHVDDPTKASLGPFSGSLSDLREFKPPGGIDIATFLYGLVAPEKKPGESRRS
ncbi:diguanylate cyclase [Candidatus Micrarchaeota archaeon]|nr:diguanylate cyclase [Candidatus Micrarchaeota archaeon]MBI5176463.1 diguanylate cyclase [Candidatus Micrarchaeota archaeon]